MSSPTTSSPTFDHLKSAGQSELMDAVDKLRSHGLSKELALPQLVVCGSQSSGKSSVLEAIAQITFPAGEGTKTRFASELVLRHAYEETKSVSLVAGPGASVADCQHLKQFRADFAKADDFPSILEKATAHLRQIQGDCTFSLHRLRVELSGPDKPHLTLVDLPGLIADAEDEKDVEHVQSIVEPFLEEPRSIILAVMPAIDDHNNHPVFRLIRRYDPNGVRTLGILTKPDRLEPGSEKEKGAVSLVIGNGNINSLALGWHVLRNRDHANRDATHHERDKLELKFFRTSAGWRHTPEDRRGVAALRLRLRELLSRVISQSLPDLTEEMDRMITYCDKEKKLLGDARPEKRDQVIFLHKVAKELEFLIHQGVGNHYEDSTFFGSSSSPHSKAKRLCTIIIHLGDSFAERMSNAQLYCVSYSSKSCDIHNRPVRHGSLTLDPDSDADPVCVSKAAMLQAIENHIEANRGKILVREYDPKIISDIFKIQSARWEKMARDYAEECIVASKRFMVLALLHVTDQTTRQRIWRHVMEKRFLECREIVDQKVTELLFPFYQTLAYTRNRAYREAVAQSENNEGGASARERAELVWNRVQLYYQTSLYTFIDNVAALAVDKCIVVPLSGFFNAIAVAELDDETFAAVAAEDASTVQKRDALSAKLQILKEVLAICHKYPGHIDDLLFEAEDDTADESNEAFASTDEVVSSDCDSAHERQNPSTSISAGGCDKTPPRGRPDSVREHTPPKTSEPVASGKRMSSGQRFSSASLRANINPNAGHEDSLREIFNRISFGTEQTSTSTAKTPKTRRPRQVPQVLVEPETDTDL